MTPKIQVKVDGSQIWYLNLEALGVEDHASGLHAELFKVY